MKLSMWHLAYRLKDFAATAQIVDGAAILCGVRFLPDDQAQIREGIVYIGIAEKDPTGSGKDAVMLVQENDILRVEGSLETVFNAVLAAFDFYNAWEASIQKAATAQNALQSIVDLSADVLKGPLFMGNEEGVVIAISRNYDPDAVDERWKGIYESRKLPLALTGSPIVTVEGKLVGDWATEPTRYVLDTGVRYIGMYATVDKERLVGIYMQQLHEPLDAGDCQLLRVFGEAVCAALSANADFSQVRSSASALLSLIKGAQVEEKAAQRIADRMNPEAPWKLLAIRNIPTSVNQLRKQQLADMIRDFGFNCIASKCEKDVVVLISAGRVSDLLDKLDTAVMQRYYSIGISLPFSLLVDLPTRYRQTQFALTRQNNQPGIYDLKDYAYTHLLARIREQNSELVLLHPALETLKHYDRMHHTDLHGTLYQYLMHERNAVLTAKSMYLHRNTLNYRLARISELLNADLDNQSERMYILLSCLIQEQCH